MLPENDSPIPIRAPDVGPSDSSLTFNSWLVDVGEAVIAGDRVAELLMRGVLLYAEAPVSGRLTHQQIFRGAMVRSGETVGEIRPEGF